VSRAVRGALFGRRWLRARLATLAPRFPDVALCVAFSGGADSTALLAALAQGARAKVRLRAVHVHHGLHPQAKLWSAHCRGIARRLGVPLKVLSVQVKRTRGASLEAQARDARYAALACELHAEEMLLTAHHADDQLETVFLQLLRGAGVAGLAAMPESAPFATGLLVRPLLTRTHAELADWVRRRGLAFIEDATNADERLDRNYLRRQVLPPIRSRWPGCAAVVARSARNAAQAQRLLEGIGRADANRAADGAALSVKALRALASERRKNALRVWIADRGWPLPDARRLEELSGPLIAARADANPAVRWDRVIAQRAADCLSVRAVADVAAATAELSWSWRATPVQSLPGHRGELAIEPDERGPIDLDLLPAVLSVRARRGGERLRPRGAGRSRTLKALLQETRVPLADRARLPLIFAGERLVAVADLWNDASIHAHAGSKMRARLMWRHR
jgi:tRNA(Ile)-lysidine synthase